MVFVLLVLSSDKPNQFNTDKFTKKFMVTVKSKNSKNITILECYENRFARGVNIFTESTRKKQKVKFEIEKIVSKELWMKTNRFRLS